jgi:hypothetical protein
MKAVVVMRRLLLFASVAVLVASVSFLPALAQEKPAVWVSYLALPPLFLLLLSGLYLFVLPHATKWRRGRRT